MEKMCQYNGLFTEDKSCDTNDVKTIAVGYVSYIFICIALNLYLILNNT